jgi:hypothetical protein
MGRRGRKIRQLNNSFPLTWQTTLVVCFLLDDQRRVVVDERHR